MGIQHSPLEYAFAAMCDRLNRFQTILSDPYRPVSDTQKVAILRASYAIEEEWILDEEQRAPKHPDM
jgi:hypothetical protein